MNKSEVIFELHALKSKLGIIPSKRYSNILNYYAKKNFGSWNTALRTAGLSVRTQQKAKLPQESAELYYFLGLLYTDGHVVWTEKKRDYQIQIYTSNEAELRMIIELFEKLFDYIPYVRKRLMGFNKKINYSIHLCSKNVIEHISKEYGLFIGAKAKRIRLPKFKLKDNFWDFLRGVVDGDGSICKNGVRVFSASRLFLNELAQILKSYEFRPSVKHGRKDIELYYVLSTYGQKDMFRLYDLLYSSSKFFYPRKKNTFNDMLKSFKNRNREALQSRLSSRLS